MTEQNSIIDVSFDSLGETSVHPEGHECTLEISNVRVGPTRDGSKTGMTVFFLDPTSEDVEEIAWWCEIPTAERMEADRRGARRSLKNLKSFYEAFNVSTSGPVEADTLRGLTGDVILGVEESQEWGERNVVKRFVAGH